MDIEATKNLIKALRTDAAKVSLMGVRDEFNTLSAALTEYDRPVLVAVMGEFKTGKSTFLNVMLGEDLLRTDELPATAVVTVLRYSDEPRIVLHFLDGTQRVEDIAKVKSFTSVGDGSLEQLLASIEFVEVFFKCDLLRNINFVDTPGLNDPTKSHVCATERFQQNADEVLWLFDAKHSVARTEIKALKNLREGVKPIAVVNRIDEIDEEEESIGELLTYTRRQLGDSVQAVVGVSAKLAQRGDMESSGWRWFRQVFDALMAEQQAGKDAAFEKAVGAFREALARVSERCEALLQTERRGMEESKATVARCNERIVKLNKKRGDISAAFAKLADINHDLEVNLSAVADSDGMSGAFTAANKACELLGDMTAHIADLGDVNTGLRNEYSFGNPAAEVRQAIAGARQQYRDLQAETAAIRQQHQAYMKSGWLWFEPLLDVSNRRRDLNAHIVKHNFQTETVQRCIRRGFSDLRDSVARTRSAADTLFATAQRITGDCKSQQVALTRQRSEASGGFAEAKRHYLQLHTRWTATRQTREQFRDVAE